MLYRLPETQLPKLQMVQNSAARLITGTRRQVHNWLHVRHRIEFKLLLVVYRAVLHLCPVYPSSLVTPYKPTRTMRSADRDLLTTPRYHLERYGRRAFSVAGPTWNALPPAIKFTYLTYYLFNLFYLTYLIKLYVYIMYQLNCSCLF